jgi:flagellar basal-body rod protein FlgF
MDNALYVGLSRQMTLRRELDIVANNIANANTTGFKVEDLMVAHRAGQARQDAGRRPPVKFVLDDRRGPRLHAGRHDQDRRRLRPRHRGQGLLQRPDRRGRALHPRRPLHDQPGRPAGHPGRQSGAGRRRRPDHDRPGAGPGLIGQDGTVSQGAVRVGKVGVVRPTTWARSPRTATTSTATPPTPRWQPRRTPASTRACWNPPTSKSVVEITKLIEIQRAYEGVAKMMDNTAELSRSAVERLGKLN